MAYTVPSQDDKFVKRLELLIDSEYESEIVPVNLEDYSEYGNCYGNVAKKIAADGGKIAFGWVIWKGSYLCEAEHHAVWEDEEGQLWDITPPGFETDNTLFVYNPAVKYENSPIAGYRVNISNNPIVDDFISLKNTAEYIDTFSKQLSDTVRWIPNELQFYKEKYFRNSMDLMAYIQAGSRISSKCLCGAPKKYLVCHAVTIPKEIELDRKVIQELNLK